MLFSLMNYVNISRNGGLLVIHFHFVYPSLYFKFTCEVYGKHIHVSRIMICWQTFFFSFQHLVISSVVFACMVSGKCDVILFLLLSWQCIVFHWLPSDFLVLVRYMSVWREDSWFYVVQCLWALRSLSGYYKLGKFLANYFFKYFFLLF